MKTFTDLTLNPLLMKALAQMGIETPTPIQAQALPILLGGSTDFLGLAATGTGKTLAFGIPLLEQIEPGLRAVQTLILCPTRELALQITGQIDLLGKFLGIRALPIYGGAPYPEQIRGLRSGVPIVVGTPGRVIDHIDRGTLDLSQIQTVILDEADEMISMGFKEDLETILSSVGENQSRIWLFSATTSRDVKYFIDKYLMNPAKVEINRTEVVPERIEQIYYRAHEEDKPEIICKLIDAATDFYGIIFCQTKALVMDLTDYLKKRGYAVDCLHGDMDQNARERTMLGYRNRKSSVLVCTDVASRGLDVKDITHVINYSLPRELDNYVHRIGRTARSGKTGFAMSLVTPSHRALIPRIEKVTKSKMREGKLPTRKEIGAKKVAAALGKFQAQAGFSRAIELMGDDWKSAVAEMSHEEIVGRFLALTFPDLFVDRGSEAASPSPSTPTAGKHYGRPVVHAVAHSKSRESEQPETQAKSRPFVKPLGKPVAGSVRGHADRDGQQERSPKQGFGQKREGGWGRDRERAGERERFGDRKVKFASKPNKGFVGGGGQGPLKKSRFKKDKGQERGSPWRA